MNEINEILHYLEDGEKKYPVAFTLNVMATLQKEYGSYDAWRLKLIKDNDEPDADALTFGFMEMINEGIDIENENKGTDVKPLTQRQVGRIITRIGLQKAFDKMKEVQGADTESTEKNG